MKTAGPIRELARDDTGLLPSDIRFIRIIVTVLFLAFALIVGLNSAQNLSEHHRVQTAENFSGLMKNSAQIGTSSQRLSLITFAAINPPEEDQRKKLFAEAANEIQIINQSLTEISNSDHFLKSEYFTPKTKNAIEHLRQTAGEFIKLGTDVHNEIQAKEGKVKTIGVFAEKTSELLSESRNIMNAVSGDAIRTAKRGSAIRRDVYLVSSAAIVLTASIVLFFIVYRLRLELQRRRQIEDRLVKTNEELENFSSIVAHDLKGPLNNIGVSVQMLKDSVSKDPESEKQLLHIIGKETDHLRLMIEALLRLSRLGAKKVDVKPFNVRDLLKETEDSLRDKIEESQGKVTYKGVPLVWGDRALVGNLFQNLIENSIKYKNGSPPEIQIQGTLTRDKVNFVYEDNGVGIPEKYRDTVFNPFVQADAKREGVGLGLSVVKKIITAHGGSIQIADKRHKGDSGTRFEFSLARRANG